MAAWDGKLGKLRSCKILTNTLSDCCSANESCPAKVHDSPALGQLCCQGCSADSPGPFARTHYSPTFPYLEEVWISRDVWHDFGHGASMETVAQLCSSVFADFLNLLVFEPGPAWLVKFKKVVPSLPRPGCGTQALQPARALRHGEPSLGCCCLSDNSNMTCCGSCG